MMMMLMMMMMMVMMKTRTMMIRTEKREPLERKEVVMKRGSQMIRS